MMNLDNQLKKLMEQIYNFKATADNSLPQNTFYLNEKDILCCERAYGESRFAYDADGLVVWARSSGRIDAYESVFTLFRELNNSEDASIAFVGGIKQDIGEYFPVSIFECHRQLFENIEVKRYVVYSFKYAYYIADTPNVTFAMRLHVDQDKHIHFAFSALNKSDKPQSIYMMSCIDAWLFNYNHGNQYSVMHRFGSRYGNGNCLLRTHEDSMVVARAAFGATCEKEYLTVQKSEVLGPTGRSINNAAALKSGIFEHQYEAANTTDIPVSADCAHYTLMGGESVRREYELFYFHSKEKAEAHMNHKPDIEKIDTTLMEEEANILSKFAAMQVRFKDYKGPFNANVFNKFVRNLQNQVSFCALGKNYAGKLIGIRDVMQQLESSLIWQPKESRSKFINALNHILEDGRPPRQFSQQVDSVSMPEFDLRKFIDQGVWIITTLHTYLSYTDDWSILEEKCGYYVASSDNSRIVARSSIVDSVLDHIIKIMDFLCSNMDAETGCLHVLYGDWNDAVDGLGKTTDESVEYGTGVSVMASLQLYQNCGEICEILEHVGGHETEIRKYKAVAETLKKGLTKHAIDRNEKGECRIVHGWGDKGAYKIGSWCDPDGTARYSCASNAFWVISGMLKNAPDMKKAVRQAFKSLDSEFGIRIFDKAFSRDMRPYVGRVATITPGTFENASSYVHGVLLSAAALFLMGESKEGWRQLELGCVLSHENCSKSPFVMPNSYFGNKEYCMRGQSFADWYTGSGTVFVKDIIKYGFGVSPNLDGLMIQTGAYLPATEAELGIVVKGHPITLRYKNENNTDRRFFINGKVVEGIADPLMNICKVFIPNKDITDHMVIEVID